MARSELIVVFDKTALVKRAYYESARKAVTKVCFDTEAEAKVQITNQVYSSPLPVSQQRKGHGRTGAARASIYANTPVKSDRSEAEASVKTRNPKARMLPNVPIRQSRSSIEGIVACGVDYGAYIEYGSRRTRVSVPARPFFSPAVKKVGAAFAQICHACLRAEMG